MNNSQKVQFISAEQTIDLRSRILRPNQAIENCHYVGDNDPSTFHLAIIMNAKILSNGTFMQESRAIFSDAKVSYRLRGMATEPEYQKQGFGKLIMATAFFELKKRNCNLLWFNARVSAEEFYKKLGFKSLENIFDIPMAGPHKVMYKWLG